MSYTDIKIEKKKDATVEITGEILADHVATYRDTALKNLAKGLDLKGFRKGKVPQDMLEKKVGEMAILQEQAHLALSDAYPKIVLEHKVDPIGQPQVAITKIAPKENLGFKITTAVMPKVELPDYKKLAGDIAKEKIDTEVTDKELDHAIENVRKQFSTPAKQEGGKDEKKEPELPELNDEFVQKISEFKTVDEFKTKLKENLGTEKVRMEKDKQRNKIADTIIEKSEISMPQMLVDGELERMLGQFKADVEQAGLTYEKYLEQAKKTDEDIRKEWTPIAEKKAKLQLVLNKIALEEKITPQEDQVKKEIEHILSHHKDAPEDRVRVFVETMLTNEEVFRFLQGETTSDKK